MSKANSAEIQKVRDALLKRGTANIKSLATAFRTHAHKHLVVEGLQEMLRKDERTMNEEELKHMLSDYGVEMSEDEVHKLFRDFDTEGEGSIDFDEFLIALRPPMEQARLDRILDAFNKMDKGKDGLITVDDMERVYKATEHPKYGIWTEKQVFEEFLKTFQGGEGDGVVTKEDFINYYASISASIDDDAFFDLMMRQAWKL